MAKTWKTVTATASDTNLDNAKATINTALQSVNSVNMVGPVQLAVSYNGTNVIYTFCATYRVNNI